eukprot:gb/GECH01008334.1/.p1 GENE.gb/GECH01008334.1/~~gb/GECH01008334.1/.p1  ORF type:complete len:109 (+),score=8.16 gb/GECH01008334.1/:1-327(+)
MLAGTLVIQLKPLKPLMCLKINKPTNASFSEILQQTKLLKMAIHRAILRLTKQKIHSSAKILDDNILANRRLAEFNSKYLPFMMYGAWVLTPKVRRFVNKHILKKQEP